VGETLAGKWLYRIGLPAMRWHALRSVFADLTQDQGVPPERIRHLVGHSSLRVTESYAYTMPQTLARGIQAIDASLNEGRLRVQNE
jgi:site-specific recombinase XerD